MGRIPRFFVDRPVFASVIAIVTVFTGLLALHHLPITQYPNIVPPTVTVTALYAGANAETVASTVAAPIEQQINGVDDMLYVSSTSTSDGQMTITVTFKPGTNPDTAQVLVQNRVQAVEPQLPDVVRNHGVIVRKRSADFAMAVSIVSPDGRYDDLYLSNYALLQVSDSLARIKGIGDIQVFGARDYSMRIWLNPNKIATLGLTAGDVVQALRDQNVQIAAGSVGAQPAPAGLDFQFSVTTQGRLESIEQFENVVIKRGSDGELARLRDVARVELGARDYSVISRLDGQPAINIGIFQAPGSNALEISNRVRAEMEQTKQHFPPGIDYRIIYDTTIFVREAISSVLKTIVEAFVLVVLVVLVFLQSWRTSLIPILAVPVSLIGTFAALLAFGFSLNLLTLLGLVLAIGIVVDDAIVVVEAVERHMARGLCPREATITAMDEVAGPILAITTVLSCVFIPTALVPGLTGSFYRQFALTIAFSTIISMVNSLTLSPALCALLLQAPHERKDFLGRLLAVWLGWFFAIFNRCFEGFKGLYLAMLRKLIRWGAIALALYVGLLALTGHMFKTVPTAFIPQIDQGVMFVNVELPEGASLERTERVVHRVEQILGSTPGIDHAISWIGSSFIIQATAPNTGTVIAIFEPFEKRARAPEKALQSILSSTQARFASIHDARVLAYPFPSVRGLSTTGGVKLMVQDRGGGTPQDLESVLQASIEKGSSRPELERVFTLFRASTPQIYADINRLQAKSRGVDVTAISDALQFYLGSVYINDLTLFGKPFQVTAQADGRFRARPEDILRLQTRNAAGEMVSLGSLVDLKEIEAPSRVIRYNLFPAAELSADPARGYSTGQTIAAVEQVVSQTLPMSYGYEWTETALQELIAGQSAHYIVPICILFVFLVLAALYENWALPLAIILIVPMGVLFSLTGIALSGGDNDLFTQVGFIVLIGLASKNAILIVEFARQSEQHQGTTPFEAAIQASRLRLKPILMTSLSFILGVVPLALATGAGHELRQALGVAVFSGMLGVTLFGLLLTPVFYVAIQRIKKSVPEQAPRSASAVVRWWRRFLIVHPPEPPRVMGSSPLPQPDPAHAHD